MKRVVVFSSLVLLPMTASARSETTMSDGDAAFAAALHGKLRNNAGNVFYSPASVRLALTMAYAGARGDTASEMERALSLPAGDAAHIEFARLLADWDKLAHPVSTGPATNDPDMKKFFEAQLERRRVVLRVVNRLWAQTGHPFREDFVRRLRDDYRAPLGEVDFHKEAERARVTINKWVADATEQRIAELIRRGLITSATKLILTNAVYFKAQWAEAFQPAATQNAPFFVSPGKEVPVPLMRRVGSFESGQLDGALIAQLPYGDGRLVMDVVLPSSKDGLGHVEEAYAKNGLGPWLKALGNARLDLMLPRFKTSSSFELADTMGSLGMRKAFHYPDADFSGIDGTHDLFIGSVVHQAFVDVDENGTEAAAATAVMVLAGAAPVSTKPIVFRADHPFLFFVRDAQSGAILFAGRLVDPSAT